MSNVQVLQEMLGYHFDDQELASQCLMHGSIPDDHGAPKSHSHKGLAYVGDAVIELATRSYQYKGRATERTGAFTKEKQDLVTNHELGNQAISMGLPDILQRASTHEVPNPVETVWADAFEAVIGAVFLDKGYDEAEDVVNRLLKLGAHQLKK